MKYKYYTQIHIMESVQHWIEYILCLILFTMMSCSNGFKPTDQPTVNETIATSEIDFPKENAAQDTVLITTELGDTLKFEKEEFNVIIDQHPEFFDEDPNHPDLAYFNNRYSEGFGSEAGQDIYFILYAYFLKQRNGVEQYAKQRKQLMEIYSSINSLFSQLQYSGTYFGHQYSRILGYAEYSIYLLPKNKDNFD